MVKTTLVVDGGEVDLTVVVPPSQDSMDENASIPVIRSPGASGLSQVVRGERDTGVSSPPGPPFAAIVIKYYAVITLSWVGTLSTAANFDSHLRTPYVAGTTMCDVSRSCDGVWRYRCLRRAARTRPTHQTMHGCRAAIAPRRAAARHSMRPSPSLPM